MEAVGAAQYVSYAKLRRPSCSSATCSYSFFQFKASSLIRHQSPQYLSLNIQCIGIKPCLPRRHFAVVHASDADAAAAAAASGSGSPAVSQGWLLEPVGDGDWKHIGTRVAMPGAYEVFSSEMLVGRVPEKADLVIPVATVSAVHARIRNKEGSLLVTDLDSTNGTFINEKRVPPGGTAAVPPGSLLTFGDTHLAIFRVSRLEKAQETEESEKKSESEGSEAAPQPEATSSS